MRLVFLKIKKISTRPPGIFCYTKFLFNVGNSMKHEENMKF